MGLTISFIILSTLILWQIIGSKGHWAIKAFIMFLSLYLLLSVDASIDRFGGWPTKDPLPDKFQVHWFIVEEPNVVDGFDGKIYIWVTDIGNESDISEWKKFLLIFEDNHDGEPRVYEVPYSIDVHERLDLSLNILKGGGVVLGGKANVKQGGSEGNEEQELIFYDLPEVFLENK